MSRQLKVREQDGESRVGRGEDLQTSVLDTFAARFNGVSSQRHKSVSPE